MKLEVLLERPEDGGGLTSGDGGLLRLGSLHQSIRFRLAFFYISCSDLFLLLWYSFDRIHMYAYFKSG